MRIEAKGSTVQREERGLRIMEGATCGDVLSALWQTHGHQALTVVGLEGSEAETIWMEQLESPKPFGKFLKGLDSAKALAKQRARFPSCPEEGTPAAMIHGFIVQGLTQGMGGVERKATARHDAVDDAAASWAWLVAVDRSGGQEWHFEPNARDRGGVWAIPTKALWQLGRELLKADEGDLESLQARWNDAFAELKIQTG
jgi:hypothetical protein